MLKNSSYPLIDVLRFFLAIVVLMVHTSPQTIFENGMVNELFSIYSGLAAKLFFAISGFLLGRKMINSDDSEEKTIERWTVRLIKIYAIWTVIYLPFAIFGLYYDGLDWPMAILVWVRNVLLIGENYLSWPLWFLLALIWAGMIICLTQKLKIPIQGLIALAVILPVIGYIMNKLHYPEIYFQLFKHTRNGLFVGFTYVILGMLMAKFRSPMKWVPWMSLVIGLVGVRHNSLFSPLVIFGLLALVIDKPGKDGYLWLRESSTIIYFVHMLFVGAISIFLVQWFNPMTMFLTALALSLLTSAILIRYSSGSRWYKLLFR